MYTGLYYHGARYYAPWLGRWTSADPAGLVDGANLFVYTHNNPVIYFDPTGMQQKHHGSGASAPSPGRILSSVNNKLKELETKLLLTITVPALRQKQIDDHKAMAAEAGQMAQEGGEAVPPCCITWRAAVLSRTTPGR